MFDMTYSGLIKVTPNFDYAPDLAEKWETPDDKTIVFHLNPNAKFQNGQPVTAKDVKWTYESLMNPTFTSPKRSGYGAVDHIETPDEHTVIFKLKEAERRHLRQPHRTASSRTGADTNRLQDQPIGSRAVQGDRVQSDDRLELEAFDQWHRRRAEDQAHHRAHHPRRHDAHAGDAPRHGEFRGQHDSVREGRRVREERRLQVVKTSTARVYQYLAFNLKDPTLAKQQVRQAIAHAIDRDRIVRDIQRGYGAVTETMFAAGHWARAANLPDVPIRSGEGETAPRAGRLSRRTARAEVPQASLQDVDRRRGESAAQMMQQMMKEAGIDMQIQSNEMSDVLRRHRQGQFPDVLAAPQRHLRSRFLLHDLPLEEPRRRTARTAATTRTRSVDQLI